MSFLDKNSSEWSKLEELYSKLQSKRGGNRTEGPWFNSGLNIYRTDKDIGHIIKSIYEGSSKITLDNWNQFTKDLHLYVSKKVGKNVFSEAPTVQQFPSDSSFIMKMFKDAEDAVWIRRFAGIIGYWGVDDNKVKVLGNIKDFNEEQTNQKILELAEEGRLHGLATAIIGNILKDYSFSDFEEAFAKKITDRIRDIDKRYEGSGNLKFLYDYYINFQTKDDFLSGGTTGVYVLSENIYDGDQKTIPKGLLSEDERKSFEYPAAAVYPDSIIMDYKGDPIEEFEESLKNFNELEGTRLSEYPFVYQKDSFPSSNWLLDTTNTVGTNVVVAAVRNFFNKDRKTPGEVIKELLSELYIQFLKKIVFDLQTYGDLASTIGSTFDSFVNIDSLAGNTIFELIYFEKIITAKKDLFDKLSEAAGDDGILTPEEREAAYRSQLKAFETGKGDDITTELSEEQIENRQRFFKQCALMMNMKKCSEKYRENMLSRGYKTPFHGRFYTMKCSNNQESLISKIVSSANEQEFFELKPHEVSSLTPKIRLFKVFESGTNETKEIEFSFDRTSKVDTVKYMAKEIDKGSGVGLKEFSFEFNGTNPAEARNDIQATLNLYFQSFTDFVKSRKGLNGNYRYADLVIQPTKEDNKPYGISLQSGRHYDPAFYRIRAEVGYYVPDGASAKLRQAISSSNKSFFLTMVDHNLDFGADGSVNMSITYRAYMESLMQHPRMDALATPELIQKREENQQLFKEQIEKKECTSEQIRELQISLQAQEEVILKQSLSSIINRLIKRGSIFHALINEDDREFFATKGFFNKCGLEFGNKSTSDGDLLEVLNSDLPEKSDDFNFVDSKARAVSFFYFGDLLYTILDCVFLEKDEPRYGMQNNKFVLGSFEFQSFSPEDKKPGVYNIAELPISVDFFSRWFVDNVTSQKDTRKSFPILRFVRTLTDQLVRKSLVENCVNRKVTKSLRFQTGQITAYDPKSDPLLEVAQKSFDSNDFAINVDEQRGSKKPLPLNGGGSSDSTKVDDYYNYIVLATVGSSLSFAGSGDYKKDIEDSRFHVHVGKDSGIVKKISLSKSDQQYIREARFFQNGIDGLLQLSSVYVATLEMFGNTIFYPGMEFFFNPYGLGGSTEFGSPTDKQSMANKLGIGGYHTVTSVKSSIAPGKFITTVAGQQYFSGASEDKQGSTIQRIIKGANLEEYAPDKEDKSACDSVILEVQNYDFEEIAAPSDSTIEGPTEEGDTDE